jgi:hypothetical protein
MLVTDTKRKAVDWVGTFTGRRFWPSAPKVDDITIIDIAHHLSNICRYNGSTIAHYSVAQHSCILCDYVQKARSGTPLDCLQILMHDAPEAWIGDMARPIKQHAPDYRKMDHDVTVVVRSWMGWDGLPIPDWQDELDTRIIADERAQVVFDQENDWLMDGVEPLDVDIEPWTARLSEQQFLARYATFSQQVYGSPQYLRSGWGITTSIYQPDFRTRGSDVEQHGPAEPWTITDLLEVDVRGGCGRVALRSPDGMMVRDKSAGAFPRPAWEFIHGKFELVGDVNAVE